MLSAKHKRIALFASISFATLGCGSSGSGSGVDCNANQCVNTSVLGQDYTVQNQCSESITAYWCEQYEGPACEPGEDGFEAELEAGQRIGPFSAQFQNLGGIFSCGES